MRVVHVSCAIFFGQLICFYLCVFLYSIFSTWDICLFFSHALLERLFCCRARCSCAFNLLSCALFMRVVCFFGSINLFLFSLFVCVFFDTLFFPLFDFFSYCVGMFILLSCALTAHVCCVIFVVSIILSNFFCYYLRTHPFCVYLLEFCVCMFVFSFHVRCTLILL